MPARPLTVWLPIVRTGGGADVYARRVEAALARRGHRAVVSLFAHPFQYAPWLLRFAPPPAEVDVIVTHSWFGAPFTHSGGAPMVTVMHHSVHDPAFRPYRNAAQAAFHRLLILPSERASVRRAVRVIAVSRHGAAAAESFLGARDVTVVLNGVDTDFFCPDPDRRPYRGDRPLELLFAGNLIRRKGADLLPRIMARVGERAILRYTGGLRPNRRLARAPNMTSLGTLSDIELRDAYRRADLLLFPSRLEGFGYVVAEALACGTPVVATRASALPEVVPEDGGVLCPMDDVDAFAAAIRELAAAPDRLEAMRAAARRHACARFGMARWARELEEVLVAAAADRQPARTAVSLAQARQG